MIQLPHTADSRCTAIRCPQLTLDFVLWTEDCFCHFTHLVLLAMFPKRQGQRLPRSQTKSESGKKSGFAGSIAMFSIEQILRDLFPLHLNQISTWKFHKPSRPGQLFVVSIAQSLPPSDLSTKLSLCAVVFASMQEGLQSSRLESPGPEAVSWIHRSDRCDWCGYGRTQNLRRPDQSHDRRPGFFANRSFCGHGLGIETGGISFAVGRCVLQLFLSSTLRNIHNRRPAQLDRVYCFSNYCRHCRTVIFAGQAAS